MTFQPHTHFLRISPDALRETCPGFPATVGAPAGHVAVPVPMDAGHFRYGAYARSFKRLFDIIAASVAIVLSAPVMALLAFALWIEGGRPFYTQLRLGRDGRQFRMLKLRSMVHDAEARLAECLAADPLLRQEWECSQKLKCDPRITPLGAFIRKTSLDELPQLFNVLRGDMSLVGPRPMLPDQLPLYLYPQSYLALRPGLTGLWQVTARNDQSFEMRAILDRHYGRRVTLWGDLRIMLATVRAVVCATGY
ncbi:MAG: sugar transferase [Pararhodobacter sp.]